MPRKRGQSTALAPLTIDEHRLSIPDLSSLYSTHIDTTDAYKSRGLTEEQRIANITKFGSNVVPPPSHPPLFIQYLAHLRNLFTAMLFLAGTLSIVNFIISTFWYNLYVGIAFYIIALINAGLEFYQEYQAGVVLKSFLKLVPDNVLVIRDGVTGPVSADTLARGDVALLKLGDKVPADLRLVQTQSMKLDLSSITGESAAVDRDALTSSSDTDVRHASCIAFSGAKVMSGEGVGVVIRTGPESFIGRIANLAVNTEAIPSQLVQQIEIFVRRIVTIGITLGILYMIIGFSRGLNVVYNFDVAIGVFVSFLPQGLPATITLLLTIGIKKMAEKNVLAKTVNAVETLGTLTLLATDKTGTLTKNEMKADKVWTNLNEKNVDAAIEMGEDDTMRTLIECACICSQSRIIDITEEELRRRDSRVSRRGSRMSTQSMDSMNESNPNIITTPSGLIMKVYGDATEVGILHYCSAFVNPLDLRKETEKVFEIPFNSVNKFHLMIVKKNDAKITYIKGAPERVLKRCNQAIGSTFQEKVPVDENYNASFMQAYESLAAHGLRSIAFAYSESSSICDNPEDITERTEFTMIGMLGLYDPPKEGVKEAIDKCKRAGIQVVMVTGDHPFTAEAIARQVHILETPLSALDASDELRPNSHSSLVINGDDIDGISSTQWNQILLTKEIVFARTLPRHKLEIVQRFRRIGHIVGVTGDGVNDAPALKIADIGISMNHSASDLSKDIASLIILDDRFATIVDGIEEGRIIYENLRKCVRYVLSHILPVALGLGIFVITLIPVPITPLLIMVIDLLADIWPAIAFAWEPAEGDVMQHKPRNIDNVRPPNEVIPVEDTPQTSTQPSEQVTLIQKNKIIAFLNRIYSDPIKGKSLVDTSTVLWAFTQAGLVSTIACFGAYLIGIAFSHVPWNILFNSYLTYFTPTSPPLLLTNNTIADANAQVRINRRLSTTYFLTIMIVQYFNAFICKHRYKPPYGRDLFVNYRMFIAILISATIASVTAFVPVIQTVFETYFPFAASMSTAWVGGFALVMWDAMRKSGMKYYVARKQKLINNDNQMIDERETVDRTNV